MLFQWTAIREGHFRLLRCSPYATTEQLSFTLESYPIGHSPPYAIVDYASASGIRDSRVSLNGRACMIPMEAAEALRRAHRLDPRCLLWMDCLCVRWNDEHESDMQRRWMSSICEHTTAVIT